MQNTNIFNHLTLTPFDGGIAMKLKLSLWFIAAAVFAFATTAPARAQDPTFTQNIHPIQIALYDPIQIYDNDETITGLRINFIYGLNQDLIGVDMGLVNRLNGNLIGMQSGLVNIVDGNGSGYQTGLVNITKHNYVGLQFGIYNESRTMSGLAFGLVNNTGDLNGLQIGLVNINRSGDPYKFLPIVNWSF
jgi:hypothetical protein